MLVLRRLSLALAEKLGKPYEQQLIITSPSGEEIAIDILGIEGERVKIGIRAPQSYEVARAELKYHGGYQHVQQHPY
jgi:carbon storage regulator CsrA